MDLLSFAQAALKLTNQLQLDDIEMLLTSTHSLSARIENREITLRLETDIFSAGIRVLKSGRIAYVPLTEPDISLLEDGINASLPLADPSPFDRFTVMDRVRDGLQMHDPAVESLLEHPAEIRDLCRDISDRAFAVHGIETFEGGINVTVEERLVMTCCSPRFAHARRTSFTAFAEVNSRDFDFVSSRRLPDLNSCADLGADLARSQLHVEATPDSEGIRGKNVPVLLHPYLVESLVRMLVAEHLYASNAQVGMSRLHLGEKVASSLITLWDDATAPFDGSTFPVDDEGSPARRNTVIEQGVLKMFLYDRASAVRHNTQSTGNGRRRPVLIEAEHEAPVRCAINDVYMMAGTTPLNEIIRTIKNGLLVKALLGLHVANKTTADIANTVHSGRIIRNGEMAAMPEPGRWAVKGNALDCLKKVSAVSSETLPVGRGVLPWLLTELTIA
ncbi:MAG: metallopeptidase TldD-related protein [candidate division WOR-3 bacterium]